MNPDCNRLEHMVDACEKIVLFTNVEFSVYEGSLEKQAAVARYFEILGEAANKISDTLKAQYPTIPWRITTALRNILIHEYVKVDYTELWKTAKEDIPPLLATLRTIELPKEESDGNYILSLGVVAFLRLPIRFPEWGCFPRMGMLRFAAIAPG